MTKFNIAVIGTPADKDSNNRYLPLPEANVEFVKATLAKVADNDYAVLMHGAEGAVDKVADDFAHEHHIRVKQFPAYWFDPTADSKVNKSAGLTRTEHMLRALKEASFSWDAEKKESVKRPDTEGVLLIFTTTGDADSNRITKHAKDKAEKYGLIYRVIEMPVKSAATVTTSSDSIPF